MSIILKHICRNIIQNKSKSILIIFSLMMATLVMYLNFTIRDDLLIQYESVLRNSYQKYDCCIYKTDKISDADSNFSLSSLQFPENEVKSYFGLSRQLGIYDYKENQITVYMYGGDLSLLQHENLVVLKDKSKDYMEEDHVIISNNVASFYGLEIDDTVEIRTEEGSKTLKIGGIAEQKGMYLQESGRIILFTPYKTINEKSDVVYSAYVDINYDIETEKVMDHFSDKNTGFKITKLVDEKSIHTSLVILNQMLLYILAGIIIISVYINRCIIKIILAKRFTVIGTLRSVGVSKRCMELILVIENLLYGLVGGGLGVAAGIGFRKPILSILSSYGNRADELGITYELKTEYIVISILFTVLLQFVVTILEIIKSNRNSIKELMFNSISTGFQYSMKKIIAGGFLLFIAVVLYGMNNQYNLVVAGATFLLSIIGFVCILPAIVMLISRSLERLNRAFGWPAAELAVKNLKNSKSIVSSITLITTVLAIMITILLLGYSINSVFDEIKTTFTGDVQLTNLSSPAEEYENIKTLEYVKDLDFVYYTFQDVELNGETLNLGLFGFDKEMNGIQELSGKMGELSENEAMIDEYYGRSHHINVGDTVTIKNKEIGTLSLKITGTVDSSTFTSSRNVCIMSQKQYIEEISDIPCAISVKGRSGSSKDLKNELAEYLVGTGIGIQTVDEFLAMNKSEIDSILSLVAVLIGMAVILGIMGIVSNQLIGFLQRKKELSIYYSIAMSRRQITRIFATELIHTFVIGCLLGAGLGIWLSYVLEQILYGIGEYVKIQIHAVFIIEIAAGMFAILLLANIFLIRRLSKLNVVEEIKCE